MARITIEDCLARIPNRFELTLAATNRARQVSAGSTPMVDADRDKPTVIALREIEEGLIGPGFFDDNAEPSFEELLEAQADAANL